MLLLIHNYSRLFCLTFEILSGAMYMTTLSDLYVYGDDSLLYRNSAWLAEMAKHFIEIQPEYI